jgi:hypothetical protein
VDDSFGGHLVRGQLGQDERENAEAESDDDARCDLVGNDVSPAIRPAMVAYQEACFT